MVMSKTPATMVAAPTTVRRLTLSTFCKKTALNRTLNSGVVLSSGMIDRQLTVSEGDEVRHLREGCQ
jgi:hypothetical protein